MNNIDYIKSKEASIYITCSGGGSGLQDILWSVPGASKYLVGASFPYATSEFDSFIGYKPHKYCNEIAAIELAMASYIRAKEYCILNKKNNPVGLGLTCALTTNRERQGKSRVYISTCNQYGVMIGYLSWDSQYNEQYALGERITEGRFVDELALEALAQGCGSPSNWNLGYPDKQKAISMTGSCQKSVEGGIRFEMKEYTPQLLRELFFTHPYFASDGTRTSGQPCGSLYMPGSFNPIHDGHRDCGFKSVQESRYVSEFPIYMISADSVHKKSLTVPEMLDRVAIVKLERYHWYGANVLFTQNDALYIDKARAFPNSDFIIGFDAAERMLDPKWGPEIIPMLHEFRSYNTRFLVCGRIVDGKLKTIKDLNFPSYFNDVFVEVPFTGSEISSTRIRNESNGI